MEKILIIKQNYLEISISNEGGICMTGLLQLGYNVILFKLIFVQFTSLAQKS